MGWSDVRLRFDYRIDNDNSDDSFDLSYSTDGGFTATTAVNDQPLTDDDAFHTATVDLSAENALENQPLVLIRIDDLGRLGNGEFRSDNFELTGTKAATNPNDPTIAFDTAATTNSLDLNETGEGFVSGVVNDPTDPAATTGIAFTLSDPDTPAGNLLLTATSSNPAVVPDSNLRLGGAGGTRTLRVVPAAAGVTTITVTVTDLGGGGPTRTASATRRRPRRVRRTAGSTPARATPPRRSPSTATSCWWPTTRTRSSASTTATGRGCRSSGSTSRRR
jgi:hypothetical protein